MAEYTIKQQLYYYLVKRFLLKSVVPFLLSACIAYAAKNPAWVALTPVFQLAEKFLRDNGYFLWTGTKKKN